LVALRWYRGARDASHADARIGFKIDFLEARAMKTFLKCLVGAGAIIFSSPAAQAADLPIKAMPRAEPIVWSWTGFYVGVHGGGAWGSSSFDFNDLTAAAPFLWQASTPLNGPLAGGQAGFNFHAGWAVLGIEADGSWANLTGHGICNTTTFFVNCAAKVDGLATVTGRVGATVDRALIYAKGGFAWAQDHYAISNVALSPLITNFSSAVTRDRTGWTVGMGVEYGFLPQWSAKIEYDFMDLGTSRINFPQTAAIIALSNFNNWDISQFVHTMKVGVNYRFGGPVVARY
jgi:outer membrane immunogenic protein